MKTKLLKQIVFLFAMAVAIAGCDSKDDEQPTSLKGTQWKLVGIVDAQTGDLRVLEPKDCEECYTLIFKTDDKVIVKSINITLNLDLSNLNPPSEPQNYVLSCEKYDKDGIDYCNSDDFCRAIINAETYSLIPNGLKIFHINSYSYLLFKPLKL